MPEALDLVRLMPKLRSCRMAPIGGGTTALRPCGARHNQSAARKASSLSSGRYRPSFVSGAVVRDSALPFIRRSACTLAENDILATQTDQLRRPKGTRHGRRHIRAVIAPLP